MSTKRVRSVRGLGTVVIACEPGRIPPNLGAVRRLKGVSTVLVAHGNQPSAQRNAAVRAAKGDWVWFLDSDSVPEEGALEALRACLSAPHVAAAGGPNLGPAAEPPLQAAFSHVLGSWFGSMSVRARYARVGVRRTAGEKELILCNLMVRRGAFVESGGFREDLYPNEENEWVNRMADAGWSFTYEPGAAVRRPRRDSERAFGLQAFRYGRGRLQQTLRSPHWGDAVHAGPALFLVYAAALPLLTLWHGALALPALAYAAALAAACVHAGFATRSVGLALRCLGLYPLRHFGYGVGWLAGLASLGASTQPAALKPRIKRHSVIRRG